MFSENTRYLTIYRQISFIHFCTELKTFHLYLFFILWKEIIKRRKVNQKPNIYSCLTFSEVLLNYVWYQATLSLSLLKNVGAIVCFEIVFAFITFLDIEFEKRSLKCLNILK